MASLKVTIFSVLSMAIFNVCNIAFAAELSVENSKGNVRKKINFVYSKSRLTPNPEGWEEYDGSLYNTERGYGWLTSRKGKGRDRGLSGAVITEGGEVSSPGELNRPELANWQGDADNIPLVFRIDLPDGWYRVTCSSVDAGVGPLPLVDRRSFKCRAHDVVFAGANYGRPFTAKGEELVEGGGIVEVTGGHLRIILGDPAYGGWTWSHEDPWYTGWLRWTGHDYIYADTWYQKLTRSVDPGFHALRLNSLEIERAEGPEKESAVVFRDYFNRDNSRDLNSGAPDGIHWYKADMATNKKKRSHVDLYQTAIRIESPDHSDSEEILLQKGVSPGSGMMRYSTRVSLFTGSGSRIMSGSQEAGILILADIEKQSPFHGTFIGVSYNGGAGSVIYRVGDGENGYRTNLEISDALLPFNITEGEFEIVVEHDIKHDRLTRIQINGVDLTGLCSDEDLVQWKKQGHFGIRGALRNSNSDIRLRQYYWYYRVDDITQ